MDLGGPTSRINTSSASALIAPVCHCWGKWAMREWIQGGIVEMRQWGASQILSSCQRLWDSLFFCPWARYFSLSLSLISPAVNLELKIDATDHRIINYFVWLLCLSAKEEVRREKILNHVLNRLKHGVERKHNFFFVYVEWINSENENKFYVGFQRLFLNNKSALKWYL